MASAREWCAIAQAIVTLSARRSRSSIDANTGYWGYRWGVALGHITLIVREPARAAALFAEVMDARIVADHPDDDGDPQTFAKFGGVWFLLVKGGAAKWSDDRSMAH